MSCFELSNLKKNLRKNKYESVSYINNFIYNSFVIKISYKNVVYFFLKKLSGKNLHIDVFLYN